MNFFKNVGDWLKGKFTDIKVCGLGTEDLTGAITLAEKTSINMISQTIARIEFETYIKGESKKSDSYYRYNIEPNPNQSAYEFWEKGISKLIEDGELLIIQQNKELWVVDSFTKNVKGMKENTYSDIVVNSESINKIYKEQEVLYFKFDRTDIDIATSNLCENIDQLVTASISKAQRDSYEKLIVTIPDNYAMTEEAQDELDMLFDEDLKEFLDPSKNAAITETNGIKFRSLKENGGSNSSKDNDSRTNSLIDSIFNYVAISYNIPPSILKGDKIDTENATMDFLTYCIKPLATMIEDEINRKLYKKNNYLQDSYCKLNLDNLRVIGLKEVANSIELLGRNGALTIDDKLQILGMQKIGGEVGKARFITKNLELIDIAMKGGE